MDFIKEREWMIFNGNKKGDEEGEFTFYGEKGITVIDYIIWDGKTKERECRK